MKVISIYELLRLIKQEKQPNKIKYCGNVYEWEEYWYMTKEKNYKVFLGGKKEDINQLFNAFNENVEIIEEEKELEEIEIQDNRIVRYGKDKFIESMFNHFYDMDLEVRKKLNELVRELNEIKKEGK